MNSIYCAWATNWCMPVDAWSAAGSWAQAFGTVIAILFTGLFASRQTASERKLRQDQGRHAAALKVAKVYIPAQMLLQTMRVECSFHDGRNPNAKLGDYFFYRREFEETLARVRSHVSEDLPLLASAAVLKIADAAARFPHEIIRLRSGDVRDNSQLTAIADEISPHISTLRIFAEYDF